MAKAKQPVTLSANGKSVTFDALLKQTYGYDSTVPSYPVETGFNVSDTIIIDSPTLSMTLYLAKTPVTWKNRNGVNRVEQHAAMLENLYFQKALCSISTTEKSYVNMAIESMSIVKSEELGYDKQVEISFRKIIVTSSKTVSIPDSYGKSGATEAKAGTASTSKATTTSSSTTKSSGSGSGSSSSAGSSNSTKKSSSSSGGGKSSVLYGIASGNGLL